MARTKTKAKGPYQGLKKRTVNSPKRKEIKRPEQKEVFNYHFVNGAFLEVLGDKPASYTIQFIDKSTGDVLYQDTISNNCWTRCFFQYFVDWRIQIYKNDQPYKQIDLDLKGKKVFISFESKSLGDTVAWFPYCEEFRKKHQCNLVVSTFRNPLFEKQYPQIRFVPPGTTEENLIAMYKIGWFYQEDLPDFHRNPVDPRFEPMQKTASDILGLDFQEIRPKLDFTANKRPVKGKYVAIAIHSTAQIKYWNRANGWDDVISYLKGQGYKVVLLSSEGKEYMGNSITSDVIIPDNYEMATIMNYMHHADFFMGVGSGLSWLAWAVGVPTVLISGFSEKWAEMQESSSVIRVGTPDGRITKGAFNRYKLDAGDWLWYPGLKDTARAFEDSRSITAESVINTIQPFITKGATKTRKTKTKVYNNGEIAPAGIN